MEQNFGDNLEQVEAVAPIRKMRGGSQAHLIATSDNHQCIVKFLNNPQGRRTLVNEVIGHFCATRIDISTPQLCLVSLSESFLASHPSLAIERRGRSEAILPGIHLGSRHASSRSTALVYDFLPSPLLHQVSNVNEFLGALVLDKLLANVDYRQAVFTRIPNATGTKAFRSQIIDHGRMFGGADWRFSDSPLFGVYIDRNVYRSVKSMADFEPWISRADTKLDQSFLGWVLSRIPHEWIEGDRSELESVIDRVLMRRRKLRELILDVQASPSTPFPNWISDA